MFKIEARILYVNFYAEDSLLYVAKTGEHLNKLKSSSVNYTHEHNQLIDTPSRVFSIQFGCVTCDRPFVGYNLIHDDSSYIYSDTWNTRIHRDLQCKTCFTEMYIGNYIKSIIKDNPHYKGLYGYMKDTIPGAFYK